MEGGEKLKRASVSLPAKLSREERGSQSSDGTPKRGLPRRISMGKMERVSTDRGNQRRMSSTSSFQRKYSRRMSRRMSLAVPAPDGGWGWVVCLASCWTNGTIFGIINSFGVLFVVMLDELEGATSFKTAWVGSVCAGLTFMLSPIASIVTDQIGCRPAGLLGGLLATIGLVASSFVTKVEYMYLTYGITTGIGFSIAYNPSLFILGLYFKKRLGLANGLVTFGSGVFTMVLPLAIKSILDSVGLANTLRVLAGVAFIMMLGALVFQPVMTTLEVIEQIESKYAEEVEKERLERLDRTRKRTLSQSIKRVFDVSIWKIRNYRIWVIGIPAGLFGYFVPFTHLVKHTNDILPTSNAELLITCLGATSGLGRLFFGYISDSPRIKNRVQLQQLSYLVLGVCTTLLPVAVNYAALITVTLVMGIFDGCFVSMMGPVAFDIVGKEKASQGIGCVLGLMSFPMMIGPPIAGLIYDLVNSYIPAFFIAGASPIIGACILCLIQNPKKEDEEDDDVFLEQTKTLLKNSSGSESSDDSGKRPRARRQGIMGYAKLESETKSRPAFYLGSQPEDDKRKESYMYGPEPLPEQEKILYSALKDNPTNPKRPRLVSNRTSNVSFSDLPLTMDDHPASKVDEGQMSPTIEGAEEASEETSVPLQNGCKPNGVEPKLHQTYSYTSKHTIV